MMMTRLHGGRVRSVAEEVPVWGGGEEARSLIHIGYGVSMLDPLRPIERRGWYLCSGQSRSMTEPCTRNLAAQ
jgi:hypothetical protein